MSDWVAPTAHIGQLRVLDATADEVVRSIVALSDQPQPRVATAYALHVGGINLMARQHSGYLNGLMAADITYADGAAAVFLAKAGGARWIERAPTTDIGLPILAGFASKFARKVRVALMGGPVGLAERAGQVLESHGDVEVVYSTHGFRKDDQELAKELHSAAPDVLIVGMGAPIEVEWVERMKAQLPPTVVITCGGWFGFLVGDEKRAPRILQISGLEWAYRLAQAPHRLATRYVQGAWNTLKLLPGQWRARRATLQD